MGQKISVPERIHRAAKLNDIAELQVGGSSSLSLVGPQHQQHLPAAGASAGRLRVLGLWLSWHCHPASSPIISRNSNLNPDAAGPDCLRRIQVDAPFVVLY
jgi:hypothetical protein